MHLLLLFFLLMHKTKQSKNVGIYYKGNVERIFFYQNVNVLITLNINILILRHTAKKITAHLNSMWTIQTNSYK